MAPAVDDLALAALLCRYRETLSADLAEVHDLRRQAENLDPCLAGEVDGLLAVVDENVTRSKESTDVLIRWLASSDA
ncbi:MAG: hypothetical protein ACRD0Q_11315 [Acidimicrobiales bacterium]